MRDYRVAGRALPPPGHSRASATHWTPRPWLERVGLPAAWRAALASAAEVARRSLEQPDDPRWSSSRRPSSSRIDS